MPTDEKLKKLKEHIASMSKVLVAFSGGVDSTFLLRIAQEVLGAENILAVTAVSPLMAGSQVAQAKEMGELLKANHIIIDFDPLSDKKLAANGPDRCYHCKASIYKKLRDLADKEKIPYIICGSNRDDLSDFRPGNKAANMFNVISPLARAKLTKPEIRKLSRQRNLPTADQPSSPCLASRIAYGLEITEKRLRQVENAEHFLKQIGFKKLRVRHHGQTARIELPPDRIKEAVVSPNRFNIDSKLKQFGFKYVTVDLEGLRTGSLNETLSAEQKNSYT